MDLNESVGDNRQNPQMGAPGPRVAPSRRRPAVSVRVHLRRPRLPRTAGARSGRPRVTALGKSRTVEIYIDKTYHWLRTAPESSDSGDSPPRSSRVRGSGIRRISMPTECSRRAEALVQRLFAQSKIVHPCQGADLHEALREKRHIGDWTQNSTRVATKLRRVRPSQELPPIVSVHICTECRAERRTVRAR